MTTLSEYRLLSFDVYGTLIDWETGALNGFQPLIEASGIHRSREQILSAYYECERAQQSATPTMKYADLVAAIHPQMAARLGLPAPTPEQSRAFGLSVRDWPVFPDTIDALKRLQKHFKLVCLSNVDAESFRGSNAGSLENFPFDLVITAEEVGSYKPDPRNFKYMLHEAQEKFGVPKERVIQTAQSQFHDHHAARKMGIRSSWIVRPGSIMGNMDEYVYDWRFNTLGDMADALEKGL
ncbi:Haloacid dehalogenase/epoxide hydrolase [Aspergillus affinis]|uniref:Haloacid dehalogenase/epoxide hydrolase n=1 Tax=Aspergillus affinis TaxID=1070780 RepID=UPI0022FE37C6|nr:Haloacid dehalogenase/epoxide hydrolase [Aspergillus affinis]KAI9039839.1 Haloacid dehalogenase/epoxide hydrolase [Aspergillus affinis]